jgi:hypothetical protein
MQFVSRDRQIGSYLHGLGTTGPAKLELSSDLSDNQRATAGQPIADFDNPPATAAQSKAGCGNLTVNRPRNQIHWGNLFVNPRNQRATCGPATANRGILSALRRQ